VVEVVIVLDELFNVVAQVLQIFVLVRVVIISGLLRPALFVPILPAVSRIDPLVDSALRTLPHNGDRLSAVGERER
jgi:hypothetical protein